MGRSIFSWELFDKMPVVGIIRNLTVADINFVLPIYKQAGFTTIEITLNTPEALSVISSLALEYNGELNVGAGTVCTLDDLTDAVNAGANFIVTPIFKAEVVKKCVAMQVPIFPGAFTPTCSAYQLPGFEKMYNE